MTVKDAVNKLHSLGFPVSLFAKETGKAPSTIQKWANGSNKYLADDVQEIIRQKILEIKEEVMKIEV